MRPDDRQYTLKHNKVLVEAIAAGIEPLEFRGKVERTMRFDLVMHDPDALFNSIAKQATESIRNSGQRCCTPANNKAA